MYKNRYTTYGVGSRIKIWCMIGSADIALLVETEGFHIHSKYPSVFLALLPALHVTEFTLLISRRSLAYRVTRELARSLKA